LGFGGGVGLRPLLDRIDPEGHVQGVELSGTMLAMARRGSARMRHMAETWLGAVAEATWSRMLRPRFSTSVLPIAVPSALPIMEQENESPRVRWMDPGRITTSPRSGAGTAAR
jgi:hypothetical protein